MSRRLSSQQNRRMDLTGGSSGNGFVPTTIPGSMLWLRSDLGVTLVTGSVSAWADQSRSGWASGSLAQGTAGQRPSFQSSNAAYSGKPTLTWTAASNTVLTNTITSALPPPYTLIAVGNTGASAFQSFFGAATQYGQFGGNAGKAFAYSGTQITAASAVVTSPCIMAVVVNGSGTGNIYVNNSLTSVATGSVGTNSLSTAISIGSATTVGTSDTLSGPIAEFIVYNIALMSTQVSSIFQYAGLRYGGSWS